MKCPPVDLASAAAGNGNSMSGSVESAAGPVDCHPLFSHSPMSVQECCSGKGYGGIEYRPSISWKYPVGCRLYSGTTGYFTRFPSGRIGSHGRSVRQSAPWNSGTSERTTSPCSYAWYLQSYGWTRGTSATMISTRSFVTSDLRNNQPTALMLPRYGIFDCWTESFSLMRPPMIMPWPSLSMTSVSNSAVCDSGKPVSGFTSPFETS